MECLGFGLRLGLGLSFLICGKPKSAKRQCESDTWAMKMLKHRGKVTVLESRVRGCNFFGTQMRLGLVLWLRLGPKLCIPCFGPVLGLGLRLGLGPRHIGTGLAFRSGSD